MSKQFDVVVGNPPYQKKRDPKDKKTQAIWPGFVDLAFKICKDNGYICLVHPSGWRKSGNSPFGKIGKKIRTKQIKYLEIHDEKDGIKTFKATTRYDWYVLQNKEQKETTKIKDGNGQIINADLSKWNFIPNSHFDLIKSFIAKDEEEKVNLFHSWTDYETRQKWMSKKETKRFKYPIIYSTLVNKLTIWYSSTNKKGHFGVLKLIFNPSSPIGHFIDEKGEYGMSQFCVGIVGNKKYLKMVAKVIKNQKTNGFKEFMESCHFTDKIFNKDIISLFRKDFWKEFV